LSPSSGAPNADTLPSLGRSNPAARFSKVDLPQPVGPTTDTNSPWPTVRLISLSAT